MPWLPGDSSGPLTPAATPALQLSSSRRPPHTPITPPTPGFATAPSGAPITRTFAARDDLVEWTRKLGSVAPAPLDDAPSSVEVPPLEPPPLLAAATATHKLPTWLALTFGAGMLALLVVASQRGRDASRLATPSARRPVAALAAPHSPAVSPSSEPEARLARRAPRGPPDAFGGDQVPSATPVASTETASAQLRMTADPQATVTVVGGRISQTEVTPVRRLMLPPGVYSVTFRSPTFGEPVVARVELGVGAARSVHADFRAALPTVVVR